MGTVHLQQKCIRQVNRPLNKRCDVAILLLICCTYTTFERTPIGVAQNIRRLRLDAGLTQEQLAARLGVARTTIAQWESGSSHPRYAMMTKHAQVFGVDRSVIVADGFAAATRSCS